MCMSPSTLAHVPLLLAGMRRSSFPLSMTLHLYLTMAKNSFPHSLFHVLISVADSHVTDLVHER